MLEVFVGVKVTVLGMAILKMRFLIVVEATYLKVPVHPGPALQLYPGYFSFLRLELTIVIGSPGVSIVTIRSEKVNFG